jgi:N4-gp56 family major capsid protein
VSNNTTTTLTQQYQNYFSRKLLDYAIQELHLNEFAMQADLPKKVGGLAISFFRYGAAASSNVQTIAEGVTPTTTRDLSLSKIDATLTQYGEVAVITDLLSMTELFDALTQAVKTMGEDAALKADDISRDELVTNGTKRYAQDNTTFAALAAASVGAGKFISTDPLDIATRLKINRGKPFQGGYVFVVPPHVSRDVQNDSDWKDADRYAGSKKIFKGELGMLNGVRYVEATNPFIEAVGLEGTYNASGTIFSSIMLSQNAFGVPKLAGDSPQKPQVLITEMKPSDSDPLAQRRKAGWKAFYTAKSLNAAWYRIYKSQSAFDITKNA